MGVRWCEYWPQGVNTKVKLGIQVGLKLKSVCFTKLPSRCTNWRETRVVEYIHGIYRYKTTLGVS